MRVDVALWLKSTVEKCERRVGFARVVKFWAFALRGGTSARGGGKGRVPYKDYDFAPYSLQCSLLHVRLIQNVLYDGITDESWRERHRT